MFVTPSCNTPNAAPPLHPPYLNSSPNSPAPKAQGSSSRAGLPGTLYLFSPSLVSLKWLQEREVSLAPETCIEVGTAAVRQTLCRGYIHTRTGTHAHTHMHTHETGQSSCSHGVEGVLYSRTAWEPVWSSMALLCSGSPILHSGVKCSLRSNR